MQKRPRYWIAAKTYGWGWGLALTWEGWIVFLALFTLLSLGFVWFPADEQPVRLIGFTMLLTLGMILICLAKREPPRWRWGKK